MDKKSLCRVDRSVKIITIICAAIITVSISVLAITLTLKNEALADVSNYTGKKKEFWLFNSDIPGLNETKTGMPDDVYSIPTIAVFQGDTVIIHFFNTEKPGGDTHSFTMTDKPYNINVDLKPGENKTISFLASKKGIFTYFCTFHQPTMKGQLIVQTTP